MTAEIQELAMRYGAAWAEHDLDTIMAMHTDDTVFHLHGGGEPAVGLSSRRVRHSLQLRRSGPTFVSTRAESTSARDTSSASIG